MTDFSCFNELNLKEYMEALDALRKQALAVSTNFPKVDKKALAEAQKKMTNFLPYVKEIVSIIQKEAKGKKDEDVKDIFSIDEKWIIEKVILKGMMDIETWNSLPNK